MEYETRTSYGKLWSLGDWSYKHVSTIVDIWFLLIKEHSWAKFKVLDFLWYKIWLNQIWNAKSFLIESMHSINFNVDICYAFFFILTAP